MMCSKEEIDQLLAEIARLDCVLTKEIEKLNAKAEAMAAATRGVGAEPEEDDPSDSRIRILTEEEAIRMGFRKRPWWRRFKMRPGDQQL